MTSRRSLWILLSLALSACQAPESISKERAFEAAYLNDAPTLERLLSKGISPNATSETGETLLYVATGPKGGAAVVRVLLRAGADPNRGQGSYTPLMNATSWANLETVEILLQAGADPRRKNDRGESALETTALAGGSVVAVRERVKSAQGDR